MNRMFRYLAVAITFVASSYYFMRRMKSNSSSHYSYTIDTLDSYAGFEEIKYKYIYDGTKPLTSLYHDSLLGYKMLEQLVTNMLEDYMEKNKITTTYLVLQADTWKCVIEFPDKSNGITLLTLTPNNYYRKEL
jgi:hypothetical protein